MRILVTGAAGFIGMHVCQLLLARGDQVLGVDNLNDYYDPALKISRLNLLKIYSNFEFNKLDISEAVPLNAAFQKFAPESVINLAAQAGVRYSINRPDLYISSNIVGFANVLEACRLHEVKHLVYASSSSVYGSNTKVPFGISDRTDNPVSLYAATKKSNELMAHSYSHLFNLPSTGIRFFTVYGPWGRPDMAPWLFTESISRNQTINVFNQGRMERDFTYITDAANATSLLLDKPPTYFEDPKSSCPPCRVVNVGGDSPVQLLNFIELIENALDKKATKCFLPMQLGDVVATWADLTELHQIIGYQAKVSIQSGIASWVDWYQKYTSGELSLH